MLRPEQVIPVAWPLQPVAAVAVVVRRSYPGNRASLLAGIQEVVFAGEPVGADTSTAEATHAGQDRPSGSSGAG